jgi:hypothetical protein
VLSLREMQSEFANAMLSGDTSTIDGWVRGDGMRVAQRMQIYINNVQVGFSTTLGTTFPVIQRLAGEDWFLQSVRKFQQCFPSRCGDIQYLGEYYPEFLHSEMDGTPYEYFVDVARLEWAYQEALTAAESAPLEIASLAGVASEEYECLVFSLRPQVRLIESIYPLLAIWRANQIDPVNDTAVVSLDSGSSRVLVIRRQHGVELHELPPATFDLLSYFKCGATPGEATRAICERYPLFNFGATLRQLVALEILADNVRTDASGHAANMTPGNR